jgi:hypothetical protein
MKPGIYYVINYGRTCIFIFEILTFENALTCVIPQLFTLTLAISNSFRNIHFSIVPVINFIIMFSTYVKDIHILYMKGIHPTILGSNIR